MKITPIAPQTHATPAPEVTWNQCVINAEDCRIKAVQEPAKREVFLAQAAYWDLEAERHW